MRGRGPRAKQSPTPCGPTVPVSNSHSASPTRLERLLVPARVQQQPCQISRDPKPGPVAQRDGRGVDRKGKWCPSKPLPLLLTAVVAEHPARSIECGLWPSMCDQGAPP